MSHPVDSQASITLLPEDPVSALEWEASRSETTGAIEWKLWINPDRASPVPSLEHDTSRESTPEDADPEGPEEAPAQHSSVGGIPEPSRTAAARWQTALTITSNHLSAWIKLEDEATRTETNLGSARIDAVSVNEVIPEIYHHCRSYIDFNIDDPVEAEDGPGSSQAVDGRVAVEGSTAQPAYSERQMTLIKEALRVMQSRPSEFPQWPADLAFSESLVERAMPFVAATLHNLERAARSSAVPRLEDRIASNVV